MRNKSFQCPIQLNIKFAQSSGKHNLLPIPLDSIVKVIPKMIYIKILKV